MVSIFKKYRIAYWGIGIAIIAIMVSVIFMFPDMPWYFNLLDVGIALILVYAEAMFFTKLASKKLAKDVLPLYSNCHVNEYINELKRLFDKKAKGAVVSLYNMLLAGGYEAVDDYDAVYECAQKLNSKSYKNEYHRCMINYYVQRDLIDQAQSEIAEQRKLAENIKNPKYKEIIERSIANAEYAIRIKQGNYEGAEEYFSKMLASEAADAPIGQASYSFSLGKLLVLKNEPERAREYLQKASEIGGDTKYKKRADELLLTLDSKD